MSTSTDAPEQHVPAPPSAGSLVATVVSAPEARWAVVATALFALGGAAQLAGAPAWTWWTAYLLCYVAGGWEPAVAGLRALRERTLDVDLLMVVAALGAAAIGQVLDGALLIVIFATSGALEAVATRRNEESVRALLTLAPARASRLTATGEERVDVTELVPGDRVRVRPGERVAADGTVVEGSSDVDQATITGEALPVARGIGDPVYAGTVNREGTLVVEVDRPASDSVVARIVTMVEEASRTKATTQLFIERVEQGYSSLVVVATVALLAVPLLLGADLEPTLLRAMTFMIVASPCALVLATMPPMLASMATAGRHGVLVKSAVVLERLADVDLVALDKTGTLTDGSPQLVDVEPTADLDADGVLATAAAAEGSSEHPVGRAVVAAAADRGVEPGAASHFRALPGAGVEARVDGRAVHVGAPRVLEDLTGTGDGAADRRGDVAAARTAARRLEEQGRTVVVVVADGAPVGVLGLLDRPRPEAAATVDDLAALTGRGPLLLTGDNAAAAGALARAVGVDTVRAGLLPQDKADAVAGLTAEGRRVAVVGDGINDGPALAAAHVGIAMGRTGSDLALETADAVLVRDDLAQLPRVLALARRARRVVRANLVIAGTTIVVLVTWDLVWHLPLPLGVAGHEGSTVLVALNGLRLLRRSAW
ncbi:cobalt-translocating P-type ATPase CtpD [Nocardioides lentus]|uniref:Cobalt-translocating P-type ATPase CtpD n=1 Tax=Nocardioides lentus TaxID=338077 RepID=A0ABP5B3Q4_9ACTN